MKLFSSPVLSSPKVPPLDHVIQAICKRELFDVNQCFKVQRPIVYEPPTCSPLVYDYLTCKREVTKSFLKGKGYLH